MGAIVYDEFQTTPENFADDVLALIDTSTDWAVLTPWHEALPSISSAEAVGQTTLSATGWTSSGTGTGTIGETLVIDRGTAEEETVVLAANSTNSFTVASPITFAHDAGSTVERLHSHTVKATTPGGAQLVVDLKAEGLPSINRQPITAYREFGASGVDPLEGFIRWYTNAPSGTVSTIPVHVVVAAGPDFLWISVEGPRVGEPNNESSGPARTSLFLGTIIPYDDADTSEPVIATVNTTDSIAHGPEVYVSRDAANTSSWVTATLASVTPVTYDTAALSRVSANASRDGVRFFWPWLVCEVDDGPRGRLKRLFYAGPEGGRDVAGQLWTLDGLTFMSTPAADATASTVSPWLVAIGGATPRPLVMVPIAGTPA